MEKAVPFWMGALARLGVGLGVLWVIVGGTTGNGVALIAGLLLALVTMLPYLFARYR